MPYVTELSDSPKQYDLLLRNLSENVAHFRKQRQLQTQTLNDQQALLDSKGLSDKVQTHVDQDGNVSYKLTDSEADKQGLTNQPDVAQSMARRLLFRTQKEDLSRQGTGTTVTTEDLTQKGNDMASDMAKNLVNTASDNPALKAQQAKVAQLSDIALDAVKSQVGRTDDTTPPGNTQPELPMDEATKAAEEAKRINSGAPQQTAPADATSDGVGNLFQDRHAAGQQSSLGVSMPASGQTTAPSTTTSPTTTPPNNGKTGQSTTLGAGASQSNGTSTGASLKAGGSKIDQQINVPVQKITTKVDPTFKDEIQTSLKDLAFQAAFMRTIHQATGAEDHGGNADMFDNLYKQRVADLNKYNELMSNAGTKEELKTDKVNVKIDTPETSAELRSNERATNVVNVRGGSTTVKGPESLGKTGQVITAVSADGQKRAAWTYKNAAGTTLEASSGPFTKTELDNLAFAFGSKAHAVQIEAPHLVDGNMVKKMKLAKPGNPSQFIIWEQWESGGQTQYNLQGGELDTKDHSTMYDAARGKSREEAETQRTSKDTKDAQRAATKANTVQATEAAQESVARRQKTVKDTYTPKK